MAVHSKDGITWLTKLKRIGELSANDDDLVFNNLGHLISADMLKEQYRQLDGKKAVVAHKVPSFRQFWRIFTCTTSLMYGLLKLAKHTYVAEHKSSDTLMIWCSHLGAQ